MPRQHQFEITAARLHAIAAQLRAEINREIGHETIWQIPAEKCVLDRHAWSV